MKKLLSIIVTICLVAMVFPAATMSVKADGHTHCVCGKTDCQGVGHNPGQEWQEWTSNDSLPTDDGYYYLTREVDMNSAWTVVGKNIRICLNGHSIVIADNGDYGIQTGTDANLTITNCQEDGELRSSAAKVVDVADNSNVTFKNFTVKGKAGTQPINIAGADGMFLADNMEFTGEYNDNIMDAIINKGYASFTGCTFDVSTGTNSAIIFNHGGTLITEENYGKIDGTQEPGVYCRAVMNADGTWNSTNDIFFAKDDDTAFGIENNGTAKTILDGSYFNAHGEKAGYALEVGFKVVGEDTDSVFLYNNVGLVGSTASVIMSRNRGLFAASDDHSKVFTGKDISIYYDKDNPQMGDVVVENADASMVDKFSVVYPANTFLKLDGTNLVLTNEQPTTVAPTTVAPTTAKQTVKATKIKKVKKGKKSAKVFWKKLSSKDANGYQIRYSLKKSMKKAKKKLVNKVKTSSVKIKKLKSGKKYYFQIRAYKDVDKKRIYSAWSKKKSCKVK